MNKNEFRRAFIMLRAALPGFGGHVRLERRTLTGTMYFIVNAPQGADALSAALAGQRDGAYYATPIGELTRDRRGQLTLSWTFDPRSIDGRPLEAYAWVVVTQAGEPRTVALTGNVEGSRPLDLSALQRAVDALYATAQAPAADLPEPGEVLSETVEIDAFTAPSAPAEAAQADEQWEDVKIYTGSRARQVADGTEMSSQAEQRAAPAAEAVEGAQADIDAAESAESADCDRLPGATDYNTAARQLGLDITQPWPGAAEPLRRLFATQAPADVPLNDGFTYVRAPMPEASGYRECLIGLRAEGDAPTAVRYALSGRYAPEPPAGMEAYRWTDEGYWVAEVDI